MEMKVQIPFQQLLSLIQSLTPSQKARLRKELSQESLPVEHDDDFIQMLLNGPVYSKDDLLTIENNRKEIAAWRSKK